MIRNIIFDFGAVLVDWDPHHLYIPFFGDAQRAEWFLTEICPYSWNTQADAGRTTQEITEERIALFPEWEKEIRMYYGRWIEMMGGQIPGMEALVRDLKERGYGVYGLTNWSRETFPLVRDRYPVFGLLEPVLLPMHMDLFPRGLGTIKYDGKWDLIDHIYVSPALTPLSRMRILRIPFLLTRDTVHSGEKPLRTYTGPRHTGGVSDHLPVLLEVCFQ